MLPAIVGLTSVTSGADPPGAVGSRRHARIPRHADVAVEVEIAVLLADRQVHLPAPRADAEPASLVAAGAEHREPRRDGGLARSFLDS